MPDTLSRLQSSQNGVGCGAWSDDAAGRLPQTQRAGACLREARVLARVVVPGHERHLPVPHGPPQQVPAVEPRVAAAVLT